MLRPLTTAVRWFHCSVIEDPSFVACPMRVELPPLTPKATYRARGSRHTPMLSILLPLIDLGITIRYAVCSVQDHAKLGNGEAVTAVCAVPVAPSHPSRRHEVVGLP